LKSGDEFIRASTSIKKDDGSRAIGTTPDMNAAAGMAIAEGKNSWRLELVQAHRVTLVLSSWGDSTVTTQPATYSSALETSSLVGSDELLGMVVYGSAGHKIGRISA
jgi:hypothetical protein